MIAEKIERPVSIGTAAAASNTTVKMLRYWEEKGHVSPERIYSGSRGFRWYSPEDVQKVTKIKKFIDQGYTLNGAVQLVDEEKSNRRK